ncbi:MAG TPA: spermine synthase, partial [Chloroflexi bacterium]|nr:spermine synthase [Chloroflexota bacterium]
PYFNPPPYHPEDLKRVLVIGLAAGTTPTQLTEIYGPISIDGVEIDPAIVEVGRRYFGMTMPNLNVHIADGRTFLLQTQTVYDLVVVDAYRLPYIPWHLTTVEFFKDVRSHLTDDGVVAINVGHTPSDWRLVDAMVATMSCVYDSVHIVAVPNTFNAIVIATAQPSTPDDFTVNLSGLTDPRLQAVGTQALSHLREPKPSDTIFTDDRAPVEQLTDVLALRYLLGFSGDGTN